MLSNFPRNKRNKSNSKVDKEPAKYYICFCDALEK